MSDDHLVFPEQQFANSKEQLTAPVEKREAPERAIGDGADNCGRRAGATPAGEATGSGSSAGGGGSPEDIDSDVAGGGGAVRIKPERDRPVSGADAPVSGSS